MLMKGGFTAEFNSFLFSGEDVGEGLSHFCFQPLDVNVHQVTTGISWNVKFVGSDVLLKVES